MMTTESRKYRAHFDLVLVILVYAVAVFGVLAVTVATYSVNDVAEASLLQRIAGSYYGSRQAIFLMISPIVLGVLLAFRYESIRFLARPIYYFSIVLLVVSLVTSRNKNVQAWISVLWGYTLQPSEFIKIGMILMLAKVLAAAEKPMSTFKDFVRIMAIVIFPAVIIMMQGEMGSLLVMIVIFAVMLYFGGVDMKILLGMLGVAAVGVLALIGLASASGSDNYRLMRILSFVNPEAYSADSYQQTQSKMAIGSGGVEGIGMFVDGSMSQLNFVPEDWTDFIFSTIGEAFGFIGCALIILLYLAIILRLLHLARYTRDKFGRLIIIGVMSMIFFHVFQNVAMSVGKMPVTGIPLPFLSYGGSNMITNMGGIGLVLNVVKNRSLSTPVQTPQLSVQKYGRIRGIKNRGDTYAG